MSSVNHHGAPVLGMNGLIPSIVLGGARRGAAGAGGGGGNANENDQGGVAVASRPRPVIASGPPSAAAAAVPPRRGGAPSNSNNNNNSNNAVANVSSGQQPRPLTTHLNVSCDECGEMPIIGTRYKSTIQPNYDVCQHCLDENHPGCKGRAEFTALETYGAATTEPSTGRSVAVHSLYDLQGLIENDPSVEDLAFYVGTLTSPALGDTVRKVLRDHTSIKSVHIHIFGTEHATETIKCLAEGLQYNTSVLSVSWNILSNRGQRGLSEEAADSLQKLMEHNTTIKYMFFQRQRGFGYAPATGQDGGRGDILANKVFDALRKTHLHTVRFAGHLPVSNDNKKKAWGAMMSNPYLRRIKATFESSDYQLDLLQADKKHQWMQRWTCPNAHDDDRWCVLKEVLDSNFVDDKVPVLYHFLRNQPEGLFGLQWPDDDEDDTGANDNDNDDNMVAEDDDVIMNYERTAWA